MEAKEEVQHLLRKIATALRGTKNKSPNVPEDSVAMSDKATAFPWKLRHLLRDPKVILEGTEKEFPDVPEELVAKAAEAERLWKASARLAKDHLLGAVQDIIKYYFTGGRASPSTCGVVERCQRAMEDIPRLLRTTEHPQDVPKESPVSMELQKLQPQVTVVAILDELLATLPTPVETLLKFPKRLHRVLEDFAEELGVTLLFTHETWCCRIVTSDDGDPLTSLSQALAAYKSTPWTTQDDMARVANEWQWWVSALVNSWARLARKATKLRKTCRDLATTVATATTRARQLQDEAARDGTAQENMGELGQALGGEVAGFEAWVRREVWKAASEATGATMVRQRLEAARAPLERLVAACDEATAFPRELQHLLRDIEATLEGKKKKSPNVPKASEAKVAMAERLGEANAHLAKDHLLGAEVFGDFINFHSKGAPTSPSACEVAEQCQRAIEDIPRLLQPPEHPRGVPEVSPVSMELQELSPALLQSQVTVVAILVELLATLPRLDEEMLLESPKRLHRDLGEFTKELRATLQRTDDTWRCHNVTSDDDDDPVTSLSQALAAYKSTPGTTWTRVTMAASKWQRSAYALEDSWAELARKATELRDSWSKVATEAVTTPLRELDDKAAHYGTAEEHSMELGQELQALRREEGAEEVARTGTPVKREAKVAASEATRATMVRQWVWAALGLLQCLVAACDEATAFPRELQRLLRDIEATLEGTKKKFPDVPEDLVAKVAEAEQLWEANARLAKDHLLGTVGIIDYYFTGCPVSPGACGVAEWCQRAMEDISRLLRPPEHPQDVPKVSPVSMEPQELSPALLQPQVTVVATLGELLATLPRPDEEMMLESPECLYRGLEEFTRELRDTLQRTEDTWRGHNVTLDYDDPVTSLRWTLAAYRSTPGTTRDDVARTPSEWQRSVAALENSWAKLGRKATELRDTCREVATEAATAQVRKLQAKALRDGTAEERVMELGQALGREEGAEVVAGHEAQEREQTRVAASEATRATMVRQRLEAALELLERLVAACDKATAFLWEMQCLLWDTKAALDEINAASLTVPEDLVAKVAVAKRLWEANARLAKDHLLGAVDDIVDYCSKGGHAGPSLCEVAERCQRAIEDIPRLLQPPEQPQSVPKLSPALLQPPVTVVATLGELLDTLPTGEEEMLPESPKRLHWDLQEFTRELRDTLQRTEDTWRCHNVTLEYDDPATSLSWTLAAYRSTPQTSQDYVARAASEWQRSAGALENSWAQLARKATELHKTCSEVATVWARELQDEAAFYGTPLEHMSELDQTLGGEEGAEGVARPESPAREEAMEAASEATRVTQQLEAALGPLQRLVAACDAATTFPRVLQSVLRDIEAALEATKRGFPIVPEDLVAKVAEAERLWEANARLAKDHLVGTIDKIIDYYSKGGCSRPSASGVAERCQRAIEDIPDLLQG